MTALSRAELYASDSAGRRIARVARLAIGYTVMPVRETPPHALSHANTTATDEQAELERLERRARRKFDALPPVARELLRLSLVRVGSVERCMPFPAAQRAQRERGGWHFVRYSGPGNRTALMATVVPGYLRQEQIAAATGLSLAQVRRRLASMDRQLVRYAELRGWV